MVSRSQVSELDARKMCSTKYLVVLVAVLSCVFITNGQPSRNFFRNDYQYIGSTKAFYKSHTIKKTWQEAKDKCETEGSLLFYANDEDEAYAVISLWNETQLSNEMFIGISSPNSKNVFETLDGLPIGAVYNRWAPGEPNDEFGREDCVIMYRDGQLNDVPCNNQYTFICKKTLSTLEWNDPCNIPDLSYKYSEKLGSCYKFHLQPVKWSEAYAQCYTEQSHLAVIDSKEEADFLAELTSKADKDHVKGDYLRGAVHLGFEEKNENWQTIIRNTPLTKTGYTEWGARQPDGKGEEKCGSMFYNGKLNDINCEEKMFFICEHPVTQ